MTEKYTYTRFILIRHAQARDADGTYGPDTPLSDLGVRQAGLLPSFFAGRGRIAALYCSPLDV